MAIEGIDVSIYQGAVNWSQVKCSGRLFAIAKATEGTSTSDPRFATNWTGIQEAGLFRGAYHYGRPGSDAATQAVHFHSQIVNPGPGDLPPILDLEQSDGQSSEAVLSWTQAFLEKLEALTGRLAMVYTGGFWKNQLGDPTLPWIGSRPLWLAQYDSAFQCPNSWASPAFWQYSGSGTVPGVPSPCDLDRFLGTEDAFRALVDASIIPPPVSVAWSRYLVWPSTPVISGPDVAAWQSKAVALGASISIDGEYGPDSKQACLMLQKNLGLNADGIVGPVTWSATFASG